MWRLTGVTLAMAAMLGLTMSHGLMATPEDKVIICHIPEEIDETPHYIEVAPSAVPAHLENHGDCLTGLTDRSVIGEPCSCI